VNKIRLSVIMVVRNEERQIRQCLESIRWAGEIVIVDQSSEDNTAAICREFTDKVYVVSNKGFCEPDRPFALSKTSNEWILYLDADERVSPRLKEEIFLTMERAPDEGSFYIPRKNIFLGKWIKGSGWYPGYVLRLFRRASVRFSSAIHTDVFPSGPSGYLREPVVHYTCVDLEEYIRKMNRYTGILAGQAYDRGARLTPFSFAIRLFCVPTVQACRKLILQKGFIDGKYGFLIAGLTWLTIFFMNVKVWEIQKKERPA